jgi:quinol monooxygenase YgiN
MINVLASITVKPAHLQEFIAIFKANIPNVLKEDGCIEYTATIDYQTDIPIQKIDGNVVTIIEKWESYAHLQAHFVVPHMIEYKAKVADMVEDLSLKVLENA